MTEQDLQTILSIPSSFGDENLVKDYLIEYSTKNNCRIQIDRRGNIYLTKGNLNKGEFYPGLCAHIDTIFDGFCGYDDHVSLIRENQRKNIQKRYIQGKPGFIAFDPNTQLRTGLGGDDLAGVFIILSILEQLEKGRALFFVEEEVGMQGSKNMDLKLIDQLGYVISFDAPTGKWVSESLDGIKTFSEEFNHKMFSVLKKHDFSKSNYSNDPCTDLLQITMKTNLCGVNLGCGYYHYHTSKEYVIIEETINMVNVGLELINKLGNKIYYRIPEDSENFS